MPAQRLGGEGEDGMARGVGSQLARAGSWDPLSEQQEQRKSSKIKTRTVYGNTKTLVTPSPPKGPRPRPLQGRGTPSESLF